MSFSTLASKIYSWAENVQNELKALEEIDTISPKVFKALKEIPTVERDVARLLVLNTDMSTYEDTLNIHLKVLRKLKRNLLERTQKAIKDSQNSIAKILSRTGKTATDRGKRIAKSIKDQENAPKKEELVYTEDVPQNILAVMRSADIETTPEIRVLIKYIDREILRAKLSEREYEEMLYELINYLDESL